MSKTLTEFREKFLLDELTIHESEHWAWSLRPQQPTLGASILSLREFATRMSDAPPEAGEDLLAMIRLIESTLSKCFAYDKINYLMLMMVDNHVHYHVIPRYAESRKFIDINWVDSGWPKQPALGDDQTDGDIEKLRRLANTLQTKLLIKS